MALDACVTQRGILIPPECENGLIHLLGVEYLEPHKQVKILYRQTGDCLEPISPDCLARAQHAETILFELARLLKLALADQHGIKQALVAIRDRAAKRVTR
jgi:hypothetical protein